MLEKLKNIKKENLYLVLAIGAGLFMAVFNPPFAGVPDEHAHYWKASSISEGYWKCTGQDSISEGAYNLPDDIKPQKIKGLEDKKIIVANLKKELFKKPSKEKKVIGESICSASPLGYIPQVLGLKIGGALGISELASFYLARIFNLLAGIFIVYWAIKIIPFGKIFFLIVGLLPMTIQQFASFGYDTLHIAFAFLFVAYVFRLAFDEKTKITRNSALILFLLAIFGLGIKPGYFLISLLVFLIPKKKFNNRTRYLLTCVGVVLASMAFFFVTRGIFYDSGDVFKDGVDPNSQILHVISNPFQFGNTVLETFYSKVIYFTETFLYKPGWLNNQLPPVFYILMIIGLIVLIKNEEEEVRLEKWQRFILLGTFLANFFLIFLSLYAVWTKVGANKVVGVQGRYFLAIAPLLLLSIYKSRFNLKFEWIKKNYSIISAVFFAGIFLATFWFVFDIYYDKSGIGKEGGNVYVRQTDTEGVRRIDPVKVNGAIAQKFLARQDYFSGIKIYVGEGVIENDILFELRDENCQEVLDKKNIKKSDKEVTSMEIKFAAMPKSGNKKFCLYSENFHQSSLEPRIDDGLYFDGELSVGGDKKTGNLVFDLIYKN